MSGADMSDLAAGAQPRWYVVHTKPRQEFRALGQLQNQQYDCFLPTLKQEKLCRGKRVVAAEPLFARYLFIRLDTVASNWAPLHSTRGVSKLLAFGDRFATVSDEIIDALRDHAQTGYTALFEKGEKVTIRSGPFAGLEGIYQMADGDARAMVLIELLNRPQKLVFEFGMLRKVA